MWLEVQLTLEKGRSSEACGSNASKPGESAIIEIGKK
jgi:hypothetical protein